MEQARGQERERERGLELEQEQVQELEQELEREQKLKRVQGMSEKLKTHKNRNNDGSWEEWVSLREYNQLRSELEAANKKNDKLKEQLKQAVAIMEAKEKAE